MMSNPIALAFSLVLTAALSACATSTPYQVNSKAGFASGGYSETKLEPNRFRVTFSGNTSTPRERVDDYLLFRAAELTLAQGFDTFTIADRYTDRDARSEVIPDPFYRPFYSPRPIYARVNGQIVIVGWDSFYSDPFWDRPRWGDEVRTVEKFRSSAEIVMTRGPKAQSDPDAFDAHAVVENLGPRIQRPPVKP